MKGKQIISWIVVSCLFLNLMPLTPSAKAKQAIVNESIYDLLVDRYYNGDPSNNESQTPAVDLEQFTGGDFIGIVDRMQHLLDMGFTMISLGSIFETETYDGVYVTSYEKIEPRFGTSEELETLVATFHENDVKVMADFSLGVVSENHQWVKDGLSHKPIGEGLVAWQPEDQEVQKALLEAVPQFVKTYDLDGVRLTNLEGFSTSFLNELIDTIRLAKEDTYVVANEESVAAFDSYPNSQKDQALRESLVAFDQDTERLSLFSNASEHEFVRLDHLNGSRFTYEMVESRMFPPTRWKLALTTLFTLPGVPVMTYGSEIAVNGKASPESHPIHNFKTDSELIDLIGNLNKIRNQSETLRTGDFEILHNDDSYVVYKRSSAEETWIIAVNNSSETKHVAIPEEIIGEEKILRGLLSGEIIRKTDDGQFRVVLDRELAEVYYVDKDQGLNTPYLIATLLVIVLFSVFIILAVRRGKSQQGRS